MIFSVFNSVARDMRFIRGADVATRVFPVRADEAVDSVWRELTVREDAVRDAVETLFAV